MFIFSIWSGNIICISWNLSENEYDKTEFMVMGDGNHSQPAAVKKEIRR